MNQYYPGSIMKTYMPVKKFIRVVSTQRVHRRDRHASLSECLEYNKESRRRRCRWKPWILLLSLSITMVYVFTYRNQLFPNDQRDESITYNVLKPVTENYEVNTKVTQRLDAIDKDPSITQRTSSTTRPPKVLGETYKNLNTLDAIIELQRESEDLPECKINKKSPFGIKPNITIDKNIVNISEAVYPQVKRGGYFRPQNCKPRHRVGIIVPFRNRDKNLNIFLYNIHPFLMRQKLEYQIFVIEQDGNQPFNKGRLFNAGFREMLKFNAFHCVILHDVDLLPMDASIFYTCPTLPRHMCAKVDDSDVRREFNQSYDYKSIFGGVISMSVDQYERANGYSNLYFGWGGEDNDMFWRLRATGYPVVRYNKSVGVYTVLPHTREPANPYRHHLLSTAVDRYKTDGLSNIEYYVVSTRFRHLCTHILVNINPRGDDVSELSSKYAKSGLYNKIKF